MSASVEFLNVIEPPTSEGVKDRMRQSIDTGKPMHIVCLNLHQEVPAPEPIALDFRVVHNTYRRDGSRTITGALMENGQEMPDASIIVRTEADLALQATAQLVRA